MKLIRAASPNNNNNAAKLAATLSSHNLRATATAASPKFQVGDFVRVPDKRNIYSKGYTTNWNRELFKIHSINKTNPVTYTLNDENGEIIQGKYYEQELLRSIFDFDSNNKTLESMNILHKFEYFST